VLDYEALPPGLLRPALRRAAACRRRFLSQLTRFYPYQPVAVGWKLSLVEAWGNHEIAWQIEDLFDAGDTIVANAAPVLFQPACHIEGPADDPAAILGSPSRFGQYSLSALPGQVAGAMIHCLLPKVFL